MGDLMPVAPKSPKPPNEAVVTLALSFSIVSVLIVFAGMAFLVFNELTSPHLDQASEFGIFWAEQGALAATISVGILVCCLSPRRSLVNWLDKSDVGRALLRVFGWLALRLGTSRAESNYDENRLVGGHSSQPSINLPSLTDVTGGHIEPGDL